MSFNILITDDSATTRAIIKRTLQMTEVPVGTLLEAANGLEALEVLQNEWVDLVMTDINMPEMNGIELVEKMKESPDFENIPVVVLSTEGSETRIEELQNMGINGFLHKPFTPEQVRDLIKEALGDWDE
jgi:two-component system, chemotaxis family, chemotaxis protein CheY